MRAFLGALTCAFALLALPATADHERGAAYGYRPQFQAQPGPPGQFNGDPRRNARGDRQVDRRGSGERSAGRLSDEERGAAYGYRPQFQAQPGPPGQSKGDPWRDPRGDRQVDRRGSGERPSGRLTDDERRDLRRDLDKANRELYRRRPERR